MIGGVGHKELLASYPGVADEFERLYARLNRFLATAFNTDGSLLSPFTSTGLGIGMLVPFAGATAPAGWLLCDGTAVNRTTYSTLFGVIGTTYGAGDGSTTFNLPDMRGKFPLGKATAGTGAALGATGGAIDHTHTGPSHTHTITTGAASATVAVQAGVGTTVATDTHTHSGTTAASGTGNTGTANPPFLALNYIVLTGV